MSRAFSYLGLGFHYFNRLVVVLWSWYCAWALQSYLSLKSKRCGSVKLAGHGRFTNVSGLEIGHNVHVNTGAFWVCEGGLTIGDNTIFARNVTIYTRNHNYAGKELPFDHENLSRPVNIGKNVWIGANVTILPGAKIGDGAIIGAGAVVAGKVPQGDIYAARPARRIRARDQEHYDRLEAAQSYHQPRYRPW